MAFLAIRKSAYDALEPHVKRVLRFVTKSLDLYATPDYKPPVRVSAGIRYYCFCSPLISIEDVAIIAIIAKNLDKIPDPDEGGMEITKAQLRQKIAQVLTRAVPDTIPDGEDPFTYTLTFNSAPAAIKAFAGVPDWQEDV